MTHRPDYEDDDHPLDGSAAAATRALARLAALASQGRAGVPVLELQLGEVVTRAFVDHDGVACLTVSARLPAGAAVDPAMRPPAGFDVMWHADEGCYVLLRRVPLTRLRSERALMDAVLETADAAQAWARTRDS